MKSKKLVKLLKTIKIGFNKLILLMVINLMKKLKLEKIQKTHRVIYYILLNVFFTDNHRGYLVAMTRGEKVVLFLVELLLLCEIKCNLHSLKY